MRLSPSFLLLAACALTVPCARAADVAVPAPMALPDEQAYLVAVIPDLFSTLGRIEAIAGMFAPPGAIQAGMLKAQMGMALGDPDLANFAGKPVIIAVGPGAPMPSFAVLVPAKDAAKYVDAGANLGLLLGEAKGDIAVLAQTPDGQALGVKLADGYAGLTKNLTKADARLSIAPDRLMTTYGGMLTGFMQMAAAQAGQQGKAQAAMLKIEMAVMMAVLADVSAVQVDLSLGADGVIGEDIVFAAKPGTTLAKALTAPPPPPAGQRAAARFSNEPALMAFSGRANFPAQNAYFADLLTAIQKRPEGKDIITPEVIAALRSYGEGLTGESAMRMRSTPEAPLLWEALAGCTDQAKVEAGQDAMLKLFTGDGAVAVMYRDMGITMAATKGARTTPSGVSVQRISTTLDETKLPPAQAEQLKAMMRDYEVAVSKSWIAMAQEPKQLDALIAGTGAGMILKAEKTIGAGRHLYADLDMIGFFQAVMRMTGQEAMFGDMIAKAKAGDPVAVGMTIDGGRGLMEVRFPLKPIADVVQSFNGARGGRGGNKAPPAQEPAF